MRIRKVKERPLEGAKTSGKLILVYSTKNIKNEFIENSNTKARR